MINDDEDDVWEPLNDALAALGGVSRNWFYRHKNDDGFFEYAEIAGRVKVNKASRRAYAAKCQAEKPKLTRRGRPRKPLT